MILIKFSDKLYLMNVFEKIIEKINLKNNNKPMLVCIDGVDTSGKTTFADILAENLELKTNINPVRVSIDRFHNSKDIRMKRGALSPEGFYYDSFNYEKIISLVLEPVKSGKSFIINGIYDYRIESDVSSEKILINNNSVILMDGIFLLRPEIYSYWDLSIFLDINFEEVLKRAIKRDVKLFGSEEAVVKRYKNRYIPGEKIYLSEVKPAEKADIVIDNNDYNNRRIIKY